MTEVYLTVTGDVFKNTAEGCGIVIAFTKLGERSQIAVVSHDCSLYSHKLQARY